MKNQQALQGPDRSTRYGKLEESLKAENDEFVAETQQTQLVLIFDNILSTHACTLLFFFLFLSHYVSLLLFSFVPPLVDEKTTR
jgi:hypothetical protein